MEQGFRTLAQNHAPFGQEFLSVAHTSAQNTGQTREIPIQVRIDVNSNMTLSNELSRK
jgi:hypothetical protein